MSYITKDEHGHTQFTAEAKNDFKNAPVDFKDAILMDMLGAMTFGCGKTRWDSPILFNHINSRKIVIAVQCPNGVQGWDGCPYTTPNPGETFAFVHEQGYEIRILGEKSDGLKGVIHQDQIIRQPNSEHWFKLPKFIRETWVSSL
jgi:hypothetical protein